MVGAPGWARYGDVVDPHWKGELLRWLAGVTNIRVLVETGTCNGDMLARVRPAFGRLYSIEAHAKRYRQAVERFRRDPAVRIYYGRSQDTLPGVLDLPDPGPLIFFLDAHATGGEVYSDVDPLVQELRIVMLLRPDSVIVIDDESSADLARCVRAGIDFTGWVREYRTGMIIMHKGGFTIPPFEEG